MFVIKKITPSLNIEGRRKQAAVIYVESKNNIIDEVADSVEMGGGLAHETPGGLIAIFLSCNNFNEILKSAIDIIHRSKSIGVRVKLGVNCGDLIVQELPGGLIKYASLGNTVSFARKLAKIENRIVVSDGMQKVLGNAFRYEKMADGWMIKGTSVENW